MPRGGDRRRRLLAAIHARAKALGWDEDTRRDVQRRVAGKASCGEMTLAELRAVADEMRRAGAPAPPFDAGRPAERTEGMRRRARALAARLGAGDAWLDAICRRQTGGTAFADASAGQLRGVVAAAWRQAKRKGREGRRAVG